MTRKATTELQKLGIQEWVGQQRQRKWKWAQQVAKMNASRWSHALLLWSPEGGSRHVGHPKLRWEDDIVNMFSHMQNSSRHDWITYAVDAETWDEYGRQYVSN